MAELELLNSASNAVVAKHVDRNYPGVLLQGDTLRIILDEIDEICEELAAKNIEPAIEISNALKGRFVEILTHYEHVLDQHGLSLPYVTRVGNQSKGPS